MATEQDVAEVITYLSVEKAGGSITLFDKAHEDLYYEPDLVAVIGSVSAVFLVNGSDSFFASQKKVWRNVEEPFQAKAKGVAEKIISVSFISNNAKNELFYVCSKFFDSQYILCDEREDWEDIRRLISRFALEHRSLPKIELVDSIKGGRLDLPEKLALLVSEISEFILSNLLCSSSEHDAFSVDLARYKNLKPFGDVVLQSGASSDRKSFLALSLLSMIKGVSVSPEEILGRLLSGGNFSKDEIFSLQDLQSSAICLQSLLGIGCSFRPTGFFIGPLPEKIKSYLKFLTPEENISILGRMFSCSQILKDLFSICIDYSLALGLVDEFIEFSGSRELLSQRLYLCSNGESSFSGAVKRNYILDLILQCSGRSQTYVQQYCGIGRLTHVATGELRIGIDQARAIVDVVFEDISVAGLADEIARSYISERYYSICTHSYCSPLYFQVFDSILNVCPAELVFGFPEKNSEVVRCWHNNYGGGAGAIKVQFLIRSRSGSDVALVRICSAHEGHSADKRKEIAAKARLLAISADPQGGKRRSNIKQILVLDGDWRGPNHDPDRHLKMIHESGWDLIIGPEHISLIEGRIKDWLSQGICNDQLS